MFWNPAMPLVGLRQDAHFPRCQCLPSLKKKKEPHIRMWSPSALVKCEKGGLSHVALLLQQTVCLLGTGRSSILGRSDESLQEILFSFSSTLSM